MLLQKLGMFRINEECVEQCHCLMFEGVIRMGTQHFENNVGPICHMKNISNKTHYSEAFILLSFGED